MKWVCSRGEDGRTGLRTGGRGVPSLPRGDRQVSGPWETTRHPDAARRQRRAGQKTKSCMCPCGPRWRSGRLRAEGRAGRAPRSSGEFPEGLLSRSPSRGNFGGATCVRCHAGARGGGGLPRSGRAGERVREAASWGPGASAPAPDAATAEGPGERGPEFLAGYPRPGVASGRSVDSPLKSNCCHV